MLEASATHPEAFTSAPGERDALPRSWWEERASRAFGAFEGPRLVGSVSLQRESRARLAHKVTLVGLFVHPDFRGRGAGAALIEALIAAAHEEGFEVLQLTVTEGNEDALRLYQRCGFYIWGTEPRAVQLGAQRVAKLHLWREPNIQKPSPKPA